MPRCSGKWTSWIENNTLPAACCAGSPVAQGSAFHKNIIHDKSDPPARENRHAPRRARAHAPAALDRVRPRDRVLYAGVLPPRGAGRHRLRPATDISCECRGAGRSGRDVFLCVHRDADSDRHPGGHPWAAPYCHARRHRGRDRFPDVRGCGDADRRLDRPAADRTGRVGGVHRVAQAQRRVVPRPPLRHRGRAHAAARQRWLGAGRRAVRVGIAVHVLAHGVRGPRRRVVRNRLTWPNFWMNLGIGGSFLAFAGLWAVPFLQGVYGMDRAAATQHTSLMLAGLAIGAISVGALSDRVGRRKPVLIATALVHLLCWLPLVFSLPLPRLASYPLFLLMGLGDARFTLSWACVKEVNPHALSGIATSVANTGVFLGTGILQPLVGWTLDRAGLAQGAV